MAGHGLEPGLGRGCLHVSVVGWWGVAGRPVGQTRSGLGGGCSCLLTSLPALSDSSESNLNAAGRTCRGEPQVVVSELHPTPSGEPERFTTLPRRNLPLLSSFKFVIASASLASRDRGHSSQLPSLSRLWHVSFKFVVAPRAESLLSQRFGLLALRRVGS